MNKYKETLYLAENPPWVVASCITVITIISVVFLYNTTFLLMLDAWNTHTYAHCYLIIPISGYLIWTKRAVIEKIYPISEITPIFYIASLGFIWLIGNLIDILVLQEYALVSSIPFIVWAILGRRVYLELLFPLWFLLFCVPFGDFLLPIMINFTADFTVGLIRLSGMPVFREGNYFSIVSGDWSVVEACAGLRYLIASITLGSLFAYINYHSYKYRIMFIVLSVIVPIFLNGLRAYLIVMIGHFSGMKFGIGDDHFVYGWVFFGVGMALLFWIGSQWNDNECKEIIPNNYIAVSNAKECNSKRKIFVSLSCLFVVSVWHIINLVLSYDENSAHRFEYISLKPSGEWKYSGSFTDWKPKYFGVSSENTVFFSNGQDKIGVIIEYYANSRQGSELINSRNVLINEKDQIWKEIISNPKRININGKQTNIVESKLKSTDQVLIIWQFNWINGVNTISRIEAKLLNLRQKLLKKPSLDAAIFLFVVDKDDPYYSEIALTHFANDMFASINKSLSLSSGVISK